MNVYIYRNIIFFNYWVIRYQYEYCYRIVPSWNFRILKMPSANIWDRRAVKLSSPGYNRHYTCVLHPTYIVVSGGGGNVSYNYMCFPTRETYTVVCTAHNDRFEPPPAVTMCTPICV